MAVLTLAAFAVRLVNLGGKSLWLDEIVSSQAVRFHSYGQLISWVRADVDQTPLFATVTWLLRGFGDGEVALRMPSVVAGALTVPAIFLLGQRALGMRIGLIAALLFAISPFTIWYAQEARPYALLMLLTTVQFLCADRVEHGGLRRDWVLLSLFTILALYTHFLAVATTIAAYAYVGAGSASDWLHRRFKAIQLWRAVASGSLVVAAYLPWLHPLLALLKSQDKGFARYGGPHVVTIAQLGSLVDGLGLNAAWLLLLVVGGVAVVVRAARRDGNGVGLLAAWLVLPLAALTARLGGATLYLEPRYFSALVPAIVLVCALGLSDLSSWLNREAHRRFLFRSRNISDQLAVAASCLLVALTLQSVTYALARPKDDYRGIAQYVARMSPRGSTVLALGEYRSFVVIGVSHYLRGPSSPVVADGGRLDAVTLARLTSTAGEVWGVVFQPTAADETTAAARGLDLNRSFTHLLLLRPSSQLSTVEQASALLAWQATSDVTLAAAVKQLNAASGP